MQIFKGQSCVFSEISFPPFEYVMTLDSPPPDPRLHSISHFGKYDYDEFRAFELQLPVLPTFLWMPDDYRTKDQIEIDTMRNILESEWIKAHRDNAA
jgi:hypothetical protein